MARLALADTGIHPPQGGEQASRYVLRDLGRAEGSEALVRTWLPPMVGATHRVDRALMTSLLAMAIDGGISAFERQIEALLQRPDTEAMLRTINCPTVVIVGAEDQ